MSRYKNYEITKNDFNYYEAVSLSDCDALMIWAKSEEEIKQEIDEINQP